MGTDSGLGRLVAMVAGGGIALSALTLAGIAYGTGRQEILVVLGPILIACAAVVVLGSAAFAAYTLVKTGSRRAD